MSNSSSFSSSASSSLWHASDEMRGHWGKEEDEDCPLHGAGVRWPFKQSTVHAISSSSSLSPSSSFSSWKRPKDGDEDNDDEEEKPSVSWVEKDEEELP